MTTMAYRDIDMTAAEAAAYLHVTEGHIRWLIANGRLPARKRGRDNFVLVADLDEYAADETNRTPGPKPFRPPAQRYGGTGRPPASVRDDDDRSSGR